jgi:hypothetical protein
MSSSRKFKFKNGEIIQNSDVGIANRGFSLNDVQVKTYCRSDSS